MKPKNRIFLTESEVIYGSNNYLKNRLSINITDKDNGSISDLWNDCDHVKTHGEEGRGCFPFVTLESKHNIYIISMYDYGDESNAEDLINWWFDGAPNEIEINNTWDDWDKVNEGIASRGGKGYVYALYAKTLK